MNDRLPFESIASRLRREVWIITSRSHDRRGGLLATWVSPASLDNSRPMMVAAIARCHFTRELIDESFAFCAHLLTSAQVNLALAFGMESGREVDKLAAVQHTFGATGSPILRECLAWLECRVVHRLEAGDRLYYWATPEQTGENGAGPPLSDQDLFAAASETERQRLKSNLAADIEKLRPFQTNTWRLS